MWNLKTLDWRVEWQLSKAEGRGIKEMLKSTNLRVEGE